MCGFSYLNGRPRCFTKSHTLQDAGDQRCSLVPRPFISPMNGLGMRLGDCYIMQEMDAVLHVICLHVHSLEEFQVALEKFLPVHSNFT